jgi:MFS family permease
MVYGLTMDEALTRHVGEFGWGQLKFLLMASVLLIPNAMACLLWVFIATDPVKSKSWECTAGPYAAACEEALASSSPEQAFCSLPAGAWQWADATSAVAQFDLVCSRKWLSQLANVFFFIGCFIGAGVFGRMCDVVGRKLPLLVSTLLVAASVLVSLASTNFWMFVGLRVGAGAGAAGQTLAIFLLSTEPAGPSWRGLANIISLVIFCLGEFVLVLVAYLLPRWQHIVLASGVANLAGLLFYPFVMESPRWLLSTGKQEAATQLLQKLCDNNHTRMPSQPLVAHTSTDGVQPSLLAVLRRPQILHRFFVLALLWFAAMAAYYGISLGAGGIPGSV